MSTQITAIIVSEATDFIIEIDTEDDNLARMLAVVCMALVILLEYVGTLAMIGVREDMRRTIYETTGVMHGNNGKLSFEGNYEGEEESTKPIADNQGDDTGEKAKVQ